MVDTLEARSRGLHVERSELVGWLAGAVAHDVNNVLAAIAGYAALIQADLEPGDPHITDAEGIRDAVLRASGLVRQLLTVGRRRTLRLEPLDASELVTSLLPLLTSACGDRVRVNLQTCPQPATILADRSLLEQALLNLAINARDAMPGGGTLTVRIAVGPRRSGATGVAAPGGSTQPAEPSATTAADEVRITVEDTGVGIEAAILPHVFEPFFTTKEHVGGSGIGLATVEDAAARCGGTVSVASRPGEGARFMLHLPRIEADPDELVGAPRPEHARGGGETVLVVDPDPEVRLVLTRVLRSLGYSVADAATARHALALVHHALDRVDALIIETSLPEMAGADLAERVRAVHPGIPLLLLSRGVPEDAPSGAGSPLVDGGLDKPFTAAQLDGALRALLDARAPDIAEA